MKGILLAGGTGSRLYPLTNAVSKQLLPVYNKPMIYYPLSVLMLAGIREILIISTPQDLPRIKALLGGGEELGLKLSYRVQEQPRGIAEAFTIGADFIGDDTVCLVLGDNIFHSQDLNLRLAEAGGVTNGAIVFAYHVANPQAFGVIEFGVDGKVVDIVEKPENPRSPWAVTGLYFYDSKVVRYAAELQPSARGELEITDINKRYLQDGELSVVRFSRGTAWLDAGTYENLLNASLFVRTLESNQGLMIGCPQEIAYRMKFIDDNGLAAIIERIGKTPYAAYLQTVLQKEASFQTFAASNATVEVSGDA